MGVLLREILPLPTHELTPKFLIFCAELCVALGEMVLETQVL
jgi:hypothetical protein